MNERTARDLTVRIHALPSEEWHGLIWCVLGPEGAIDLVQFQPGAGPGSCILRHTSLARRPSLCEAERKDYTGILEILSAVFTGEDVAALERAGDGIAHTARNHLLIGKNEPGVQNIIRTLRAASQERDV